MKKVYFLILSLSVALSGVLAHGHDEQVGHMPMPTSTQAGIEALKINLELKPAAPRVGQRVDLILYTSRSDFEENHGAYIHVIGVRRDLEQFFHTHAEPMSTSTFLAKHTFNQPGRYRVWLEAKLNGQVQRFQRDFTVAPAKPTWWERIIPKPRSQSSNQDIKVANPIVKEKFDQLSRNGNSNCSLAFQKKIMTMPDAARLQGSCCTAMSLHRYAEQIEGLKKFSYIPEVPADPYDVEAKLAKRLMGYYDLKLTSEEQVAYDYAMTNSHEKGPCCCKCWRWQVYGGLGKYLIQQHKFTGQQLTQVWNLSDGCGGEEGHSHT